MSDLPFPDLAQAPDRSCVICALPRSGSTLLSYGLEDTGVVGRPREYFGMRVVRGYARQWGLPGDFTLCSFLRAMAKVSMTSNGVSAVKIHHFDFVRMMERARAEFGGMLDERELLETCFPGARCIFIRRSDRVRQAISFTRALQTMKWEALRDDPAIGESIPADLSIERIDQFASVFAEREKQWTNFFTRNGIPFCEVVYEDLASEYEATILRVLDFLEVAPLHGFSLGAPRTIKQSDDLTERAVARYAQRLECVESQSASHDMT
jgi:trehalose 2-sulfotransferase